MEETPLTGTVEGVEEEGAVLPVADSGGVSCWDCLVVEGMESIVGGLVAEFGALVELGILGEGEDLGALGEELGTLVDGEEFVLGGRVTVPEFGCLTEPLLELSVLSGVVELSMSSN